ncbi:MAG: pyruvate ferredoxin oxidoreductase [Desulfobacteraceae bacterium]|nr:pyruvate ferredoxin oxidoreductase [Desulfobacteraceae bacterium]
MRQVIKGNHAVSQGVRLARVKVISAYPITPQTTIVEELSEMCARGQLDSRYIKVESEHSAMAAVIGSASAGVRSFTATSSQGLLLMHEVLHWAAGSRLPIVLTNVNRAVAPGWNIWADQTDSLAQRDTGWIQIYAESNQEVLDNVLMAYRLAETVMLPVMLAYDAFFLSHTSEVVDVPEPAEADAFLPAFTPPFRLDLENPRMFGGMVGPDMYYEQRYAQHQDALRAADVYREICREFDEAFGRKYDLVETYRTEDAELVVATAGTVTSVSRIAVDRLREEGWKVGLLKLRMIRPVPRRHWQKALGGVEKVVVIDRNLSPGLGGVLASEVRSALHAAEAAPQVFAAVAGLGGRDVTPEDVAGIVRACREAERPGDEPLFWGLKTGEPEPAMEDGRHAE